MSKEFRIGVLISGGGTDLQSIIDANLNVVRVISGKADAYGLVRAKKAGIPCVAITKEMYTDIDERMAKIEELLVKDNCDLVVLAGYLSILTGKMLETFKGRVINIHPALLPKYGGKGCYGLNVHKMVLKAGDKTSGATVHYVDAGIDTGRIILQREVPVMEDDTPQTLQERVLAAEHVILPEAIKKLEEKFVKEGKL